jgi:hypothetical protein
MPILIDDHPKRRRSPALWLLPPALAFLALILFLLPTAHEVDLTMSRLSIVGIQRAHEYPGAGIFRNHTELFAVESLPGAHMGGFSTFEDRYDFATLRAGSIAWCIAWQTDEGISTAD